MIYVGIDVSSEKHNYMIMNHENKAYSKDSIEIPNNESGYEKLHKSIQEFCGANKDYIVRIGLESTAFYHINIQTYLTRMKYDVMVINPSLVTDFEKGRKVHSVKNDNLDAIAICKFLKNPDTEFIPYTSLSYHSEALKSLSRERFKLVKRLSQAKLRIYRLITLIFPEYLKLFTNIYKGTPREILVKYPSPSKIASAHISTLDKLIHGKCKTTAKELHDIALNSIGKSEDYLSFELQTAYNNLDFIQSQVDTYENKIKEIIDNSNTKLLSIPGIKYITGALIMGELGDINKFKSAESIVAYAGIDNKIYESGKNVGKSKCISKKGSKYLRYALYQISNVIWINDSQFKEYYFKKKSENKHYYVILGHIMKKLIRVIYSVLKNNKEYYIPQK